MRLRRFAKTVVAVAPLVLGTAGPAHGCLVLPENQGTDRAAVSSEQIECGPVGCGPNAPFEEMQEADALNQGQGFECDPMCVAGNPDQSGGPTP
ncbi:MAG TPA: hypothetical protein VG078_02030 [Acidimicrobiales bacterium]|nr:hypothetical protein [Acidimicrobiales bacterium]